MSILIETTSAIKAAFDDIKAALTEKGVNIPEGYLLSDVGATIRGLDDIPTGFDNVTSFLDLNQLMDALLDKAEIATIYPSYLIDLGDLTTLDGCFQGCNAVTSISLPSGFGYKALTLDNCFNGCSLLESLDLPDGFGYNAISATGTFGGCTALTTITGSPQFKTSIDLSECPLTSASVTHIIEGLQQSEESPILTLGSDAVNNLTSEDRTLLSQKGWEVRILWHQ